MRVMLVDDRALADRLSTMLAEVSADIEVVGQLADPRERLDAVGALRPDVIVLDPWMPGGSGIRTLQRLRRRWRAPVVIVFTNHPYLPYRKRCLDEGADFFLDKSTQLHRLPEVLQDLLGAPRRR
jgi:DNA-binding NarL/FixJ family response regulator